MLNSQLQEIVRKLTEELHPGSGLVRIYAYGSRVRGDEDVGSDLDLLVELRRVTPEIKRKIKDRAWELSLASGFVISALIVSEEVFERGPLATSEFAENIRRYGVEVLAS